MANISFDSLVDSKPVKIDLNGTPVCVTRIGDEVFAIADIVVADRDEDGSDARESESVLADWSVHPVRSDRRRARRAD